MKKLTVCAVALACVLGLTACRAANSAQDMTANTTSKADALMEAAQLYVETGLKYTDVTCVLGKQLSAYKLAAGKLETIGYEMHPVFVENKVLAFATCILSDTGEYITGCGVKFAESFWQEFSKHPDAPIAIVYAQEGAYLVREGELPVMLREMPAENYDSIEELDNWRSSLVYSGI